MAQYFPESRNEAHLVKGDDQASQLHSCGSMQSHVAMFQPICLCLQDTFLNIPGHVSSVQEGIPVSVCCVFFCSETVMQVLLISRLWTCAVSAARNLSRRRPAHARDLSLLLTRSVFINTVLISRA